MEELSDWWSVEDVDENELGITGGKTFVEAWERASGMTDRFCLRRLSSLEAFNRGFWKGYTKQWI